MAATSCDNPALELRVLGCSGGAAPGALPTSFLLGDSIAIDAGSLASQLSLDAQACVRHILLTHAHLDHFRELPLFLDNVFGRTTAAPVIHALPEVIAALEAHVFNGTIWPRLDAIDPRPAMFRSVAEGEGLKLGVADAEFEIRAFPGYHGTPAIGYLIQIHPLARTRNETAKDDSRYSENQRLETRREELLPRGAAPLAKRRDGAVHAITTDTGFDPVFFDRLAEVESLATLVIEVSFPSRLEHVANASFHLTPRLLDAGLERVLRAHPKLRIFASHLKPPYRDEIRREIADLRYPITALEDGQTIAL